MKSFKEIKKSINKEIKERKYKKDDEGRIIVNMTVKNDDDFLSPFSENELPVISEDVADFIDASTKSLPLESLTLRISSDCIDKKEEELYRSAIKEYYTESYIANNKEIKRNYIIASIMAIAGILILGASIIFGINDMMLVAEIIDIAAWVFLWEAIDISLLQNNALRLKRKRLLSYIDMKIEYEKRTDVKKIINKGVDTVKDLFAGTMEKIKAKSKEKTADK